MSDKPPMEHALDVIWEKMYPGTTWGYPAQVAAHVLQVFRENTDKIKDLKNTITQLKEKA